MLDRNHVINMAQKDTDINEHLMNLYNIPVQIGAKTIVEIGAGESTLALTAAANKTEGQFYSIDLKAASVNRSTPGASESLKSEHRYHLIEGDDMEIVKTWDKEIDFLFIDSSHTYQHTKAEIKAWFPFVKRDSVIMMHDTNHSDPVLVGCRGALDEFLKENGDYAAVHLSDTKIIGMSIVLKL